MLDPVSESDSSSHVAESRSSVSLNVGNVKSFPGKGVGHLFLYLLGCTGLSSVSLLYDVFGS